MVTNTTKSLDEKRTQTRDWLAPVMTEDTRKEAKAMRHESTCNWILGLAAFQKWATCEGKISKILWLHGPAGFGKTVLCSRIIEQMDEQSDDFGQVLYFFCSGDDSERKRPFAILKSWIGQLLAKDDTAVEVAIKDDELQQKISEGVAVSEADQDCLWSLFRKMINHVSHCTLVIDGYDECTEASTVTSKYHNQSCRTHFLQELVKTITGTGTHVLLVSRNQQDIKDVVMGCCEDPESLKAIEHSITKDDTTGDVSSFSKALFARNLKKKMNDMAGKAAEKSEGMFLWIALLDKRLSEGATKREVKKLLSETPSEIDEAYERELDRILNPKGDQRLTKRAEVILKWVLFAARPLTVREMAEALAVSFNDFPSEYPRDDLPDPFTEESVDEKYVDNYILKPCGSLIELRKEHASTPLASHTIHFVHFSVKEFLLRKSTPNQSSRRLCFREESTEQDWLAGLCLQYMCYDEFDDTSSNMKSPDAFFCTYPFFSYIATSWPGHFHRGQSSDTRLKTPELVWKLFNTAHWKVWAKLFEAEMQNTDRDPSGLQRPAWGRPPERADSGYGSLDTDELGESGDESDGEPDDNSFGVSTLTTGRKISPSPVYYATILGLNDIVERLIKEGNDCNLLGGELGTPLQAAVVNQQGPTIEVLLKHEANTSQKGGKYGTPLIAAVILGSADIFDKLIGSCKDLDAADKSGKTALHYACGLGAIGMVTKLVDAGANPSLASKSGRTPLIRAIRQKHPKVVQYLLEKGADANERTREGQPPLWLAIEMENEEIAKQLLEHNANLRHQNQWGMTALHEACYVGSAPLTRLLLEHGAAVDATDEDGWMPLHYAAEFNEECACTELMLDSGALLLATENGCSTPFAIAVRRGAKSVIEAMNNHEERSASGADSLLARLGIVLEYGYTDLIAPLLKSCSWPSLNAETVRDIMDVALKDEQQVIFAQLIANLPNPDGSDKSSTDLYEDPVWSNAEEQILKDEYWGNNAQRAMVLNPAWRRFKGARNIVPDAMLSVALANRSRAVVELLLERGANAYRKLGLGSASSSPLQLAVNQDSRELVALIFAKTQQPAADNVLLAAIEDCSCAGMKLSDMAKLLITHGALDANPDAVEDNTNRDDPSLDWWTHELVGEWTGSYYQLYESECDGDSTGFRIERVFGESSAASKKGLILFSGDGKDTVDEFIVHGQIISETTVRFVKLYPRFGWAYKGSIDKVEGGGFHMKGQWGRRFDKSSGHFVLTKELSL